MARKRNRAGRQKYGTRTNALRAIETFSVGLMDRFMSHIDVLDSGCWEWTGVARESYSGPRGDFIVNGWRFKAHRVSWMLHFGPIPGEIFVLHDCDNSLCVNPEHLFLGTQSDNMKDCAQKGRIVSSGCAKPKITLQYAIEIARLYRSGIVAREIAEKYGIHRTYVYKIAHGKHRPEALAAILAMELPKAA